MPGLSFGGNQSQNRRSNGFWWVPLVLIVISIALITLCVRFDGGGPFSAARSVVQGISRPVEVLCSGLGAPFSAAASIGVDERIAALEQENQQLQTLVAELEEYRQQDQRLTMLTKLGDAYGLETVSAQVVGTTKGWNRTSTINKGTNDGIKVGMGVMSTCGLYGQVESTTDTTATIRLVNDANSSVSAMVQSSRARGILSGSYDGTLTLEYVSVNKTVGEGDIVISSGEGGTYPQGLVIGKVRNVETDSSKLCYRITVEPIYNIESCEEVMVLTGNESETTTILDDKLLDSITKATTSASPSEASSDSSSASSASVSASSATSAESSSSSAASSSASASSSSSSSLTPGELAAARGGSSSGEDGKEDENE